MFKINIKPNELACIGSVAENDESIQWHRRLAHTNLKSERAKFLQSLWSSSHALEMKSIAKLKLFVAIIEKYMNTTIFSSFLQSMA